MITRQATMLDFLHGFHRKTKRRAFLETMDASVPWEEWLALIRPYCYADYEGKRGRPPVALESESWILGTKLPPQSQLLPRSWPSLRS